ncbi:MAG: phosphotransferase [Spirochaetales bacterium]|nr:phosphotransferase [Spirochaetales bacterium]
MMKLSLMRDVFTTVNTDWDCELAAELAKNWKHDKAWIKMWRASANFICYLKNEEQHYVIRFNQDSERKLDHIESEIKLLHYLKSKDISIAEPVLSRNNKFIESKQTHYGKFFTCVFERVFGEQKEIGDLKKDDYITWGESLGELHKAFKGLPKVVEIHRISHIDMFEGYAQASQSTGSAESNEIEYLRKWLNTLNRNKENYGLIHYDFELDNIIWNENGVHIIDFDDSIYSWYVADIAYALRDVFFDSTKPDKDDERFLLFIKGYRKKNAISEEELIQMPVFYRLHNFISYKKLQRSIDLSVSENNPTWLNELIIKLTNIKDSYYKGFLTQF